MQASPEKPEKGDKDEKADKADKVASPPQKSKGSSPNLPAVASAGRLAEQANGHHRYDCSSSYPSGLQLWVWIVSMVHHLAAGSALSTKCHLPLLCLNP